MSGAITRRLADSTGRARRQLAQALTPGPEPWMNSSGGWPGRAAVPRSCTLVLNAPVRTLRAISGFTDVFIAGPQSLIITLRSSV